VTAGATSTVAISQVILLATECNRLQSLAPGTKLLQPRETDYNDPQGDKGMRIARIMLIGTAAVGLVQLAAQAADDTAVQEMQDRVAIEALMWRYIRALDTLDEDTYAALFTPDGSIRSRVSEEHGTAEIKKMITDQKTGPTPPRATYHVIGQHAIQFMGRDQARVDAYWMATYPATGDTPASVWAVGRSVDMLVRVNGQWLIKSRDVSPE
jgi:uncharacterized protein (TIGR02246 family)